MQHLFLKNLIKYCSKKAGHRNLYKFSPYIKKGSWNQGWNEVYVAPGISFYVFEMIPEDFLTILRALRGEEDITNDEALEFLASYEKIPATIITQNKVKTSKPANNISSETERPTKAKKEGVDMNVLEAAWKTNLAVRPEKDWEQLKGKAVV